MVEVRQHTMFCKVCIDGNRQNTFTTGSTNFRTSSLNEHMKGIDHKTALMIPKLKEQLQQAEKKSNSNQEKGVLVAMRTVFIGLYIFA